MKLSSKFAHLVAEARSIISHRVGSGWRSYVYPPLLVLVLAGGALYLMQRELKSALAWSADAGSPVLLKPIKAEQEGRLIAVAPPASQPCPAILVPQDSKTRKEVEALGVNFATHSLLATGEIKPAPYGGQVIAQAPKIGGPAELQFTARNPLAAIENRFSYYAGPAYDARGGLGARAGVEWDAFSFRLPKSAGAFRLFGRVSLDGYLFSGRFEGRASVLGVVRRP